MKYDELNKLHNFSSEMIKELNNNNYKGSIFEFNKFEKIITELEYHKAKMFIAIRVNNKQAIKEYIADTANFLLALGNSFNLYDDEFVNKLDGESFEINKDVDVLIKTTIPSINQKLV